MTLLFISHSSQNNAEAKALSEWLTEEGWSDQFLDFDPELGIAAGVRWEKALRDAASRCDAVLFLISADWLAAEWCCREFTIAQQLGKRPFLLLISGTRRDQVPMHMKEGWQIIDLASGSDHELARMVQVPGRPNPLYVSFSKSALIQLREGLKSAGLDPQHFLWPPIHDPMRPPYRGILPMEAEDAGIYFGREAPTIDALAALRMLRRGAAARLFVILGASGAGKSSFLRAGILPRLMRDQRHFLTMPIVCPEDAALSGRHGLIASLWQIFSAKRVVESKKVLWQALESGASYLLPFLDQLADRSTFRGFEDEPFQRPTLVLPIDQFETLFHAESPQEATQFLSILRSILEAESSDVIAICTLRSDSYGFFQDRAELSGMSYTTFGLPSMPKGMFKQVIEAPLALCVRDGRKLEIEPTLTEALLRDVGESDAKDALPLLAFTLDCLFRDFSRTGRLSLAAYEQLGRMEGVIAATVEQAILTARYTPGVPDSRNDRLALIRRGLVPWLVGLDHRSHQPYRKVATLSMLPEAVRPLLEHLAEHRILTLDSNAEGKATIELTHEALFRIWNDLRDWIEEERANLLALESIRTGYRDWAINGRESGWLSHSGSRLLKAEALQQRQDFAGHITAEERSYLDACRELEDEQQSKLARERQIANQDRRIARFRVRALAAVALIAVVVLAIGLKSATDARMRATSQSERAKSFELAAAVYQAQSELATEKLFVRGIATVAKALENGASVSDIEQPLAQILDGPIPSLVIDMQSSERAHFFADGKSLLVLGDTATFITLPSGMTERIRTIKGDEFEVVEDNIFFIPDAGLLQSSRIRRIDSVQVGQWLLWRVDERFGIWDLVTGKFELNPRRIGTDDALVLTPNGDVMLLVEAYNAARNAAASEIAVENIRSGQAYRAKSGSWLAGASASRTRMWWTSRDASQDFRTELDFASGQVLITNTDILEMREFYEPGLLLARIEDRIQVMDSASQEELLTIRTESSVPEAWISSRANFVAVQDGQKLSVRSLATGDQTIDSKQFQEDVTSVKFDPADRLMAVADESGVVHLIDLASKENTRKFPNHSRVERMVFSPDSRFLLVQTASQVLLWCVQDCDPVLEVATWGDTVRIDDDRLLFATLDGRVRVLDVSEGLLSATARHFATGIEDINANKKFLVLAGKDVFDLAQAEPAAWKKVDTPNGSLKVPLSDGALAIFSDHAVHKWKPGEGSVGVIPMVDAAGPILSNCAVTRTAGEGTYRVHAWHEGFAPWDVPNTNLDIVSDCSRALQRSGAAIIYQARAEPRMLSDPSLDWAGCRNSWAREGQTVVSLCTGFNSRLVAFDSATGERLMQSSVQGPVDVLLHPNGRSMWVLESNRIRRWELRSFAELPAIEVGRYSRDVASYHRGHLYASHGFAGISVRKSSILDWTDAALGREAILGLLMGLVDCLDPGSCRWRVRSPESARAMIAKFDNPEVRAELSRLISGPAFATQTSPTSALGLSAQEIIRRTSSTTGATRYWMCRTQPSCLNPELVRPSIQLATTQRWSPDYLDVISRNDPRAAQFRRVIEGLGWLRDDGSLVTPLLDTSPGLASALDLAIASDGVDSSGELISSFWRMLETMSDSDDAELYPEISSFIDAMGLHERDQRILRAILLMSLAEDAEAMAAQKFLQEAIRLLNDSVLQGDRIAVPILAFASAMKDGRVSAEQFPGKMVRWLQKQKSPDERSALVLSAFCYISEDIGCVVDALAAVSDHSEFALGFYLQSLAERGFRKDIEKRESLIFAPEFDQSQVVIQERAAAFEYGIGVAKDHATALHWYRSLSRFDRCNLVNALFRLEPESWRQIEASVRLRCLKQLTKLNPIYALPMVELLMASAKSEGERNRAENILVEIVLRARRRDALLNGEVHRFALMAKLLGLRLGFKSHDLGPIRIDDRQMLP